MKRETVKMRFCGVIRFDCQCGRRYINTSKCEQCTCGGEVQTNADRIRTMTDEELAIWILKHDTITEREGRKYGLDILDWLKAEVEP